MYFKNWIKLAAVFAVAAAPVCQAATVESFFSGNKKTISWKQALEKANKKVDEAGASSVLGAAIGEHVRRISVHTQENKKMNQFYASLLEKNDNQKLVRKCQANYRAVKEAANANRLFNQYGLTAIVPADFCELSYEDLAYIRRFFQNRHPVSEARQYKEVILLTLSSNPTTLWFVVNPQNKMITFNYNDPKDLESLEELQTKWKELTVN